MISEFSLAEYGLMTVEDACALKSWVARTVQKWIADGLLPVASVGPATRRVYLLRRKDVDAFAPPPRGRPPAGPKPAAKKPRGRKRAKPG